MAKSTVKSIEKVDDFKYRVESSSGSVYQITCTGSIDLPGHPAEYGLLWDCNCPARGSCHHLQAVIKYRQENEESEEVEFNPTGGYWDWDSMTPEVKRERLWGYMMDRLGSETATDQILRNMGDDELPGGFYFDMKDDIYHDSGWARIHRFMQEMIDA